MEICYKELDLPRREVRMENKKKNEKKRKKKQHRTTYVNELRSDTKKRKDGK